MEQPFNQSPERRYKVGMRMVKTVVSVFICGLLGYFREQSAFYSMIAAIICLQNSTGKTIQSSVNRALGTLIGGAAGVLIVYLMDILGVLYIELVRYLVIAVMLIPIIQITLWIKRPTISAFACVVFLCVTVNHSIGDTPALFALNRMLETLIGVAVACLVDVVLPYRSPAAEQSQADAASSGEQPSDRPQQKEEETP